MMITQNLELTRHGIEPYYVKNTGKGNSHFLHLKTEKRFHKPVFLRVCAALYRYKKINFSPQ